MLIRSLNFIVFVLKKKPSNQTFLSMPVTMHRASFDLYLENKLLPLFKLQDNTVMCLKAS